MLWLPSITALSALACLPSTIANPLHRRQGYQSMVYDFAELAPSPDLQWTPCFDKFTCTILEVPLDYEDEDAGTTGIAFIKWSTNATNSSSAQDIFVNPGGPGGSGVALVLQALDLATLAVGTQNNIVGFDPRSVNNSGPDISCFPGHKNTVALYEKDFPQPVEANDTRSLAETWARAGAFGDWCTQVHSGSNSSAKYVNTVATATDMLYYTQKLAESKGENPDKSQLWYYGVSYGTVLGSTFAALFPDRIGRMILDGVVDGEDYYQGKWQANLPDADAALETFFKFCYEGGQDECAFWDESPEAIKARYNAVVDSLKARPIIVTDESVVDQPAILTYIDFLQIQTSAPYSPSAAYPLLAQILAELEQGVGTMLAAATSEGVRRDSCSDVQWGETEPRYFIACNDANGRFNLTDYSAWEQNVDFLVNQSKYLGEAWAGELVVGCRSLNIKSPESQLFTGPPSANRTSNPILFVSNTIDPVTPLRAAEKMTALFGGARLLTQNGVGHASSSAFSKCTTAYTKQYVQDASLPPQGTLCQVDEIPFKSGNSTGTDATKRMLKKRHPLGAMEA